MHAYVFPGQASQFEGMGKDLYEASDLAKKRFEQANELLGFRLSDVMFEGSAEDLKQTRVTQPAVFLHSIVSAEMAGDDFRPDAVAGHSLGEFSALVAAGALSFESGLLLVKQRAEAMQRACEQNPGTMAAILGLEDEMVEKVCAELEEVVIPANYNCPGQLVISGTVPGVEKAVEALKEAGAKRAIILPVGGAFHSPLMQPAKEDLATAIAETEFRKPQCPIYQNVNGLPSSEPSSIRKNLMDQLTSPVRWTLTMQNMIRDGVSEFVEVGGNGKTLQGFVKKLDRQFPTRALTGV
jgi:[acyl-carrier-protein] S-malonyltransferase